MGRLGEEPGRPRIDREHPVPVLHGVAEQRSRPVDAGIAHEPIEATEGPHRVGDHARGLFRLTHVRMQGQGFGAQRLELAAQAVEPGRGAEIHRRHLGGLPARFAIAGQAKAGRPPDSARRSRHQYAHPCLLGVRSHIITLVGL